MLRGLLRGMLRGLLRGLLRVMLRVMLRGLLRGLLRGMVSPQNSVIFAAPENSYDPLHAPVNSMVESRAVRNGQSCPVLVD